MLLLLYAREGASVVCRREKFLSKGASRKNAKINFGVGILPIAHWSWRYDVLQLVPVPLLILAHVILTLRHVKMCKVFGRFIALRGRNFYL
jgi:hypothetical protein